MPIIDILIAAILTISVFIGIYRGFVKEAISIAALLLAIWAALNFGPSVGKISESWIGSEELQTWFGRILVFLLILAVGGLIGWGLSKLVRLSVLSGIDRLVGGFFGAARGVLFVALFMLAGALQQRLHTRELSAMSGLWAKAPRMGVVTLFFVVASLGMPGLGTFIGEFLILLGAFQVNVVLTVVAAIGIIVAAVYSLSLMQRSFQGPANADIATMKDFGVRELGIMIVMGLALVWLGVAPQGVLDLAEPVIAGLGVMP